MKWMELTSPEIAALDRKLPLVMNISAVEQHGPHLPVGTDAMVGAYFLERIDAAMGDDLLILPQLKVCCSQHHMDFGGTLTIRHETMLAYVCDVLESALSHGFSTVVLFNSHGGNEAIGRVIVEKLGYRHPEAQVVMLTWWTVAAEALRGIQQSGFGGVGHACEFETSLLMHFASDLVRAGSIADPDMPQPYCWARADMLNAPSGLLYRSMKAQSGGSGVVGRPSFASAEKGERIAETVTSRLCAMLRDLRDGG